MMINKVILIGHLGGNPKLTKLSNDKQVVNFSLATSESWKDEGGVWQERTEWHFIKAWGGLAEGMDKRLKKGSKVYLEGKLSSREWEDDNNTKRRTTEILVDKFWLLDKIES